MNSSDTITIQIGGAGTQIIVPAKELSLASENDPILTTPCLPVDLSKKSENESLVSAMIKICEVSNGLGLAANQLGLSRQLFVMAGFAFFNPEILDSSDEVVEAQEGCLSFPDLFVKVTRPKKITLAWYDIEGKRHEAVLDGTEARIVQHEMDHLAGKTLWDHLTGFEKQWAKKKRAALKRKKAQRK